MLKLPAIMTAGEPGISVMWKLAKRVPGHTTDKRGTLSKRRSKKGQTTPGGRVAVVQLPANVA
ncbi:hypothetical protein CWM52_25640 [Raoultella sp. T31]|nr:hypothetical protein CWM52_25640 [Raoultella sp. T31]